MVAVGMEAKRNLAYEANLNPAGNSARNFAGYGVGYGSQLRFLDPGFRVRRL